MDFDPFDFAITQPLQRVAGSADNNPDEAARAVDLYKATGVPAPVIANDLPGFEQIHKQSLTNQIMRSNPALIDYVRSHPMAASVSNDDWANLADVAKSSSRLHSLLAMDPIRAAGQGAISGFEEGLVSKPILQQGIDHWYSDKPLTWAITSAAAFPANELIRGFNALMGAQFGAIKGGAQAAYMAATGDEGAAEDFGYNAVQIANIMLAGSMADVSEPSALVGQAIRQREALQAAKPWTDANLIPPRGVHPAIDKSLIDLNSEGVSRLKQVLQDSQRSSTLGRSYESFHIFVDQQHGDTTVGIHGPAVAALYGDKVPEPGDGLLGFAPHIGDQLLAAHLSGNDIHIPIKDWLSQDWSKVDPTISQQLYDNMRMFHGGVTKAEAEVPFEPRAMVDAPIAQIRGSAGLEPRFSLGDRKLTLEPVSILQLDHRYNFVDSTGVPVGELRLTKDEEAKELYIDWITGLDTKGIPIDMPNSLGPAAVRDVLRQLKEKYTGYTLTGLRVSGAREVSGGGLTMPQVKLSLDKIPSGWDKVDPENLKFVDNAWRQLGPNTYARLSDAADTVIHQELRRIIGQFPQLIAADEIHSFGYQPLGIMQPKLEHPPIIAWNALNPLAKRLGVASHEAIHYLRGYGFFTDSEWAELGWHAIQNDWLGKYNIRERYSHLDAERQIEEAVAEGYRDWSLGAQSVTEPTGLVTKAFQKMKDLWQAISDKLRSVFGGDIDVEDLLSSIHQGRIARRGPQREPIITGVMEPKYSLSEEDFQNIKANALGLDAKSWKNLQASLKARHESDLVAAVERAERQQRQTQTAEWKSNLRSVRAEVERTIRQRPDVASDLFVNSGEYEGQKLRQRIPLKADDLTPEQKATLPDNYYAKSGLPVSDIARLFGYQDGQHLVERLSVMASQRGDRTPQAHLKSLIDEETQLRMERQYGKLEDNIMEAASDQALSDTDINLLVDEYHAAGMLAKQPTIDKNTIKAQVQDAFSKIPLSAVSSQRLMAEMARHDRDTERSLIPGQVDEVSVLKSMELKVNAGMMAAEARKTEKEMKQLDKTLRSLRPREKSNLPQPYLNFLHQIMAQIERPTSSRTPWDLKNEIANHDADHTLEGFVADLNNQGQETHVWPQLFDKDWHKPYKELTVDEFRNVKDSIDNLNYIGKQVKKITNGTTKADLGDIKESLIAAIRGTGVEHYDIGGGQSMLTTLPRTALAKSLQLETIFNHWDKNDPFGVWTQYGIRPLIEAASDENITKRDLAKKLGEVYKSYKGDMEAPVFNPLFRDMVGGDLHTFDRSNLLAVMLNTGSRGGRLSNLTYLAQGHGLKEDIILKWIDDNATKDDWDWCQKIWDLFKTELWVPAQRMRRSLDGVGAKSLEVPPIQTKFGTYDGGYYPVMKIAQKQSAKSVKEGLLGEGFIRATTWDGYAQERTGAYAPLQLELDPMASRIGQIAHDIAMRPAILNAAKLFYDDDIRTAITRYQGKEYADLLKPYLRDVANVSNTEAPDALSRLVKAAQKNIATSLIGFNIGTVEKHFPTALVLSMNEVGPVRFLNTFKSMFSINEETGQRNWEFAKSKFEEIANRDRNWMETLTGTSGEFIPGESLGNWRQRIAQWGAKPVALSDMISAVPTSLAAYYKALGEGKSEGDATFLANRAVRRAHGSSAITNQSAFQRQLPSALTYYYTFFNTMLNRQAELVWKAGDALGVTKQFTWDEAKKAIVPVSAGTFATILAPAIIEQLVSPIQFKPDDSKAKKYAAILGKDLSSSWLVARDVANWMIEGRDPALGLYSTAFHELGDIFKDTWKTSTQRQKMSKEQASKIIKDSAGFAGLLGGFPLAAGKAGQFVYGTHVGDQHPQGPWGWVTGLRYGTLAGHSPTAEQWWRGK